LSQMILRLSIPSQFTYKTCCWSIKPKPWRKRAGKRASECSMASTWFNTSASRPTTHPIADPDANSVVTEFWVDRLLGRGVGLCSKMLHGKCNTWWSVYRGSKPLVHMYYQASTLQFYALLNADAEFRTPEVLRVILCWAPGFEACLLYKM
jgi:hypothetical protein